MARSAPRRMAHADARRAAAPRDGRSPPAPGSAAVIPPPHRPRPAARLLLGPRPACRRRRRAAWPRAALVRRPRRPRHPPRARRPRAAGRAGRRIRLRLRPRPWRRGDAQPSPRPMAATETQRLAVARRDWPTCSASPACPRPRSRPTPEALRAHHRRARRASAAARATDSPRTDFAAGFLLPGARADQRRLRQPAHPERRAAPAAFRLRHRRPDRHAAAGRRGGGGDPGRRLLLLRPADGDRPRAWGEHALRPLLGEDVERARRWRPASASAPSARPAASPGRTCISASPGSRPGWTRAGAAAGLSARSRLPRNLPITYNL